jgi:acyl-CoA synthetase (AMP-forming)/AMP-acid ligase II
MTERYVTMRDLLDDRVRQSEKELCYTFLVGFEVRNQWNYADLYREVAKVGAHLRKIGSTGKRALILYPEGSDFIEVLLSCLSLYVVAVPGPLRDLESSSHDAPFRGRSPRTLTPPSS